MPLKLHTKQKAPDGKPGSAPSTPTATNASGGNSSDADAVSCGPERNKRGKAKKTDEKTLCNGSEIKDCGKQVHDDAVGGIECEVCLYWYHPECQGGER